MRPACAVLPLFHVTGMPGSMNGPLYRRRHHRAAAALGPRRRGADDPALPRDGLAADLHDGDRLPGQPGAVRLRPVEPAGGARRRRGDARRRSRRSSRTCTGLDYVEGYGMSETMAATHINPPHRPKQQCLGIPVFDVDARIVDPETPAGTAALGETGEIVVHGPQVMQGYWNDPRGRRRGASSRSTASASCAPATSRASTRTATSSWSTGSSA